MKQYFTSLKPSQDVCFWRVLICILNIPNAGHFVNFWYTYMTDYFYFHCHDKDLWSSLQILLLINEPHFIFLCVIMQLFLCCIPLTLWKVYCYIITIRDDSLESVEFLCENQECIDNLVTIGSHSALISSGHFPKELRFQKFCFLSFSPPPPPCFTNVWCVQVELSKVWVCTYVEPWGEEPPHDGPHHTDTPDCTHVMTIFWYCLHTLSLKFYRFVLAL